MFRLLPYIFAFQVADGFDVADAEIVKRLEADNLVITAKKIVKAGLFDVPQSECLTNSLMQLKLQNKMPYAVL